VYTPPACGTGAYLPSGVGLLATEATCIPSPECKILPPPPDAAAAAAAATFSSDKKTVSPSGVNATSPKISSRLNEAGLPRFAIAAWALDDRSLVVKIGVGRLGSVMVYVCVCRERRGNRVGKAKQATNTPNGNKRSFVPRPPPPFRSLSQEASSKKRQQKEQQPASTESGGVDGCGFRSSFKKRRPRKVLRRK